LIDQPKERLRLDVEDRRGIGPSGDLVVALEKEQFEMLDRFLSGAIPRAV
jgi:hypothetical protein